MKIHSQLSDVAGKIVAGWPIYLASEGKLKRTQDLQIVASGAMQHSPTLPRGQRNAFVDPIIVINRVVENFILLV
jgi:hypothetical protein